MRRRFMAKGNDGNYLQHGIEVASAARLAKMDAGGRLHIALTHGMAPFEAFDAPLKKPKPGLARKLLKKALGQSNRSPESNEQPIVKAYRKTEASDENYPNSAELLGAVIGKDKLSGGITETRRAKHEKLVDKWRGSSVAPVPSSWRAQVDSGGILACPDDLRTPWLFTMDPMTYKENYYADDASIYRADIDRLSSVLTGYVRSGKPGIAALFAYGVERKRRCRFWKFMDELKKRIGVETSSCWLTHQGGNRNLAGLLCSGVELSADFAPCGVNEGRG